jgi:tetratricopeptide (TPR) repeat protein
LGVGNADLEHVAAYQSSLIMIQKGEFEVAQGSLVKIARAGVDDPDLVTAFGLAALRLAVKPDQVDPAQRSLVDRVGQIELRSLHTPDTEAMTAYRNLLTEMPTTPGVHYAYGNFLISAGRYDEGIEQMQNEIEISPRDPMAPLQIAMTELRINQPDAALPYAEKAVALAPKLFAAHYALGWTLYHLGQNDRAIPELEQVVKLAPDSLQGHYALSVAYARADRKADAARERSYFSRLKQQETSPSGTPASGKDSSSEAGSAKRQ